MDAGNVFVRDCARVWTLQLLLSAWLSVLGTTGFVAMRPALQLSRTRVHGHLATTFRNPVSRRHRHRGGRGVCYSTEGETGEEASDSHLRACTLGAPRPATSVVLGRTCDEHGRSTSPPRSNLEQHWRHCHHHMEQQAETSVDWSSSETAREGEEAGERLRDVLGLGGMASVEVTAALVALVAIATGVAAVSLGLGHGSPGAYPLHWWSGLGAGSSHDVSSPLGKNLPVGGVAHLTPLRSLATGAGAGITRAVSRTLTFPLDTVKTRQQVSKLRREDRASMPEEMRRVMNRPASFRGVFKGFSAFLIQAAPSNAIFFLVYDTLNALGTSAILTFTAGRGSTLGGASSEELVMGLLPTALHFMASFVATIPANLVRTPAEVVKQRLQVGQQTGTSLEAARSIVASEGFGGLFVGFQEQLLREIPFNAIQFATYEGMKSYFGGSGLWTDAIIGAASSSTSALATHPIDTVKTRVMTKSVPGAIGEASPGFTRSAVSIAKAEGLPALYLGLLPRLGLVSTGGAFYFFGEELVRQLIGR